MIVHVIIDANSIRDLQATLSKVKHELMATQLSHDYDLEKPFPALPIESFKESEQGSYELSIVED